MDPKFNVSLISSFLSAAECDALFRRILGDPTHFKHGAKTAKGAPSKKRNKTIYGELSEYKFVYMGKTVVTPIRPWSSFPELKELERRIGARTGQACKTCVIQIYNSGAVGIKPHRDKEMVFGDIIASISLGVPRIMRFERSGWESKDILLPKGSLCLIKPPTNDVWLHSIPCDESTSPRISLIFR